LAFGSHWADHLGERWLVIPPSNELIITAKPLIVTAKPWY
jgi:hypothetical protein